MEGVDMGIFTLPEEGEEIEEAGEKNSLVRFFEGVNVDLNVSFRSYLASQGSSNRQQAIARSREEPVTGPQHASGVPRDEDDGSVEGKSLQPNTVGLTTSGSGRSDFEYTLAADESDPNQSGLKSFRRSVDSGSDNGYVLQVARGLHDLMDIIGHAQGIFTIIIILILYNIILSSFSSSEFYELVCSLLICVASCNGSYLCGPVDHMHQSEHTTVLISTNL